MPPARSSTAPYGRRPPEPSPIHMGVSKTWSAYAGGWGVLMMRIYMGPQLSNFWKPPLAQDFGCFGPLVTTPPEKLGPFLRAFVR